MYADKILYTMPGYVALNNPPLFYTEKGEFMFAYRWKKQPISLIYLLLFKTSHYMYCTVLHFIQVQLNLQVAYESKM